MKSSRFHVGIAVGALFYFSCGNRIAMGAIFRISCGIAVRAVFCFSCGNRIAMGAIFWISCGNRNVSYLPDFLWESQWELSSIFHVEIASQWELSSGFHVGIAVKSIIRISCGNRSGTCLPFFMWESHRSGSCLPDFMWESQWELSSGFHLGIVGKSIIRISRGNRSGSCLPFFM